MNESLPALYVWGKALLVDTIIQELFVSTPWIAPIRNNTLNHIHFLISIGFEPQE